MINMNTKLTEEQISNRKRWVDALRSGKYSQGTDCLKSATGDYCCLGVAYDTLGIDFTEDTISVYSGGGACKAALKAKDGNTSFISEDSKEKLGLVSCSKLIDANDKQKLTFSQIADLIDDDTNGIKFLVRNIEFKICNALRRNMTNEVSFDKDLRTKWVEALRSGKYTQARGVLREENSYCCLGVACDVAGVPWRLLASDSKKYSVPHNGEKFIGLGYENWLSLPGPIRDKLGLAGNQEKDLANMNDFKHLSFKEIADAIEKMPIELKETV